MRVAIFGTGYVGLVTGTCLAEVGHQVTCVDVDAAKAIDFGEVIFIAVGTPPDEDGSADLQYVLNVARSIGAHLTQPAIIVNKSTVPVGTADKVRAAISETLSERGVDVAPPQAACA